MRVVTAAVRIAFFTGSDGANCSSLVRWIESKQIVTFCLLFSLKLREIIFWPLGGSRDELRAHSHTPCYYLSVIYLRIIHVEAFEMRNIICSKLVFF